MGESSQDFQNGRIAMALDGEWRTAFIKNGTPDLNYGTAPSPVPDGKEDLYGIGRVGGTIIMDPSRLGARGRGVAPREVHGHQHREPRRRGERDRQRPDDVRLARVSRAVAARAVRHVPRRVLEPELPLQGHVGARLGDQDLLASFAAKWQSGKISPTSKLVSRMWSRSTISWSKPAADRGGGAIAGP